MRNILLLRIDEMPFDPIAVQQVLSTEGGFRDVRFNEPGVAVIEADYVEPEDWTIVSLSRSLTRISLSGTSDAAFRAALILQKHLLCPLRMIDTDYSFDLVLQNYSNVDELRAAIAAAQAH
jgi:hypothetical protein